MKRKLSKFLSSIYQLKLWIFMSNLWKFAFIKTLLIGFRFVSTYYFIVTCFN